jgi:hypothetical protein
MNEITTKNIEDTIYNFDFIMRKEINDYEARDDYMYWFRIKLWDIIHNISKTQKYKKLYMWCLIELEFAPPQKKYTGNTFSKINNQYCLKKAFFAWKKYTGKK